MNIKRAIYPITLIGIVLGLWFIGTNVIGIKPIFIPTPKATAQSLWDLIQTQVFFKDLLSSWYRVLIGFTLSFIVAYPITLVALLNDKIKNFIFYFVEFFRYLPIPVFVPLTILWFGVEDFSKIVIIFLGTFAQMIPMFYDSVIVVEKKYSSFNAALKWTKIKYIEKVIMTGSAPAIMDNARICLGWAWTYLVVAEIVGAEYGLGYAIIRAQRYLATDKIFAYIIIIGLVGILTDRIMNLIKRITFPWHI